ncbi:MAG: HD domain-containing phosphohydrolase [Actinomycetota bacterium]
MRAGYGLAVASLFAVAVGCTWWADDVQFVAPTFLFWLVVIAASLCVLTAAGVGVLAHRLDQVELAVVAVFFLGGSALPLVHGITVPGVLYDDNPATMTAVFLAIPAGALAAQFVAYGPGRWRVRLLCASSLIVWLGALLLMYPDARIFPDPGSALGITAGMATFVMTVAFGWRHVRLAEIAERPQPLVVAFGYILLGASALVFLGASMWSSYFWLAHAVDITGVFLATVGAIAVYHRQGSMSAVMKPITALAPRQAFEIGLSPVVHRLVANLEQKDRITRDHVVRTGALAIDVAMELGLAPIEVRRAGLVALLHDVGKLEIPDEVLQKPGRLTDDEFEIMKRHTEIGAEMVSASEATADLALAVRAHHERVDGRGYPDGLSGTEIPMVARIVAVCDSYDAMAYTRHYREGMDADRVRSILSEHAGAQWDESVVDALLRVIEKRTDRAIWSLDSVGRDDPDLDPGTHPIGCGCVPEVAGL